MKNLSYARQACEFDGVFFKERLMYPAHQNSASEPVSSNFLRTMDDTTLNDLELPHASVKSHASTISCCHTSDSGFVESSSSNYSVSTE